MEKANKKQRPHIEMGKAEDEEESAVRTLYGISKICWSLGRKPKDIVGTVCRKVFVGFVG